MVGGRETGERDTSSCLWTKEALKGQLQLRRVIRTTFRSHIRDLIREFCTANISPDELLEGTDAYPKEEVVILLLVRQLHASINVIPRRYFTHLPDEGEVHIGMWPECRECLVAPFDMSTIEIYLEANR